MKCENHFCIYWKNYNCILKEITLDMLGICQACIPVSIAEKDLQKMREKELHKG